MGVFRTRPSAEADGQAVGPERASAYSDAYVIPVGSGRGNLAEEGSFFTVCNATTATEIDGHAAPVVGEEATKPLLYIYNGGSKYITMDQICLRVETVATTTSDVYFTVVTTDELSRDSGGTQLTPVSCRSDNPVTSAATVYFGAVVTTPSAFNLVARTLVRQTIQVTEDRYNFQFGEPVVSGPAYVATISDINRTLPPVVIAPGGELLFATITPAAAATADYEVMASFWER